MKCRSCNDVELTSQEERSDKKICYYCMIDTVRAIEAATKMKIPIDTPDVFGRSVEEVNKYLQKLRAIEEAANEAKTKMHRKAGLSIPETEEDPQASEDRGGIHYVDLNQHGDKPLRPGQFPNMGDDHIGGMISQFLSDDKPLEFFMGINDDFQMKLTVPAPLTPKMQAGIQAEFRRFFANIVYMKMQGTIFEKYFRGADEQEPPKNPFQQML